MTMRNIALFPKTLQLLCLLLVALFLPNSCKNEAAKTTNAPTTDILDRKWWKEAVVYQI
jgi:hypothetical protein